MANKTEVPNIPGSAEIVEVIHVNEIQTNDITLFVMRIDIHSDVNITAHQCDIQIADYENILEIYDIGPGDAISFTIKEGGAPYERRYKVKKIHDIINLENGKLYKIKCVSELEYNSIHNKISRFYSGPSHEIAIELLYNYTRENTDVWEISTSNIEIITPYWSPLQTLKWLGSKSRSSLTPTSFLFFQDSAQNWNFTSLANLKTIYGGNPETYRYYQTTHANNGVPNTSDIKTTIQSINFYDAFDIQGDMKRGNIKNTSYDHDFTRKTFEINQNSYWDTFSQSALNPHKLWKQEDLGLGKITRSMRMSGSGNIEGFRLPNDEVDEDLGYSRGMQIEIQIYGNSTVDIGQILNIEIPKMEPHKANGDRLDTTWSGLYYVVAKHDAYDKSGHTMALRLAKDSFI